MARGVNKVILIGNLGQDPDIRFTQNQKQVANVSIPTSEQWTDKQTGQKQEKTEWHRVVFFDRLAEIVGQYLKKGSKVYIEGKLQTRKWQNQQGVDQYTTEVVANEMQMLDSQQQGQNQGGYSQPAPAPQAQPRSPQPAPAPQQPMQAPPQQSPAQQQPGYPPQGYQQPQQPPQPPQQQPYSAPAAPHPQTSGQPQPQGQQQQSGQQQPGQAAPSFNDMDDDIPF